MDALRADRSSPSPLKRKWYVALILLLKERYAREGYQGEVASTPPDRGGGAGGAPH